MVNIIKCIALFFMISSVCFATELRSLYVTDPDSGSQANVNADGQIEVEVGKGSISVTNTPTIRIVDAGAIPAEVDNSTHSLQIIDYAHHAIHSGSHYYLFGVEDLAINNVIDFQVITTNTSKRMHFTFELQAEKEFHWIIYEGGTITNYGSALTPVNNRFDSTNTSENFFYIMTNASLADANADTSVIGATVKGEGIIGAGQSGGADKREREIILNTNTVYIFRGVFNAAGYADYIMEWYEHADKN